MFNCAIQHTPFVEIPLLIKSMARENDGNARIPAVDGGIHPLKHFYSSYSSVCGLTEINRDVFAFRIRFHFNEHQL